MRPYLSVNGTSQMEGKPIAHICIFPCSAGGHQPDSRAEGRKTKTEYCVIYYHLFLNRRLTSGTGERSPLL